MTNLLYLLLHMDAAPAVSEAPGHPVCGQPLPPWLLPHHAGPLQLPAASKGCRTLLF